MPGRHAAGMMLALEQATRQHIGGMTRVSGFIRARGLVAMIDYLDLQANPRSSRTGPITDSICDSIRRDTLLFPLKTRGILLAASGFHRSSSGRIRVSFYDRGVEGILDGGHNILAIGMLILESVGSEAGFSVPRSSCTWSEFKELWTAHREDIAEYLHAHSADASSPSDDPETMLENLCFLVPIELLVPDDPDDEHSVIGFRTSLLDICEARNNSAQLTSGAKANQKGYFDKFENMLREHDPRLAARVEWKTNDGGIIRVDRLIALAWIPLSLVDGIIDDAGRLIDPPAPPTLYSSKGSCLDRFERLVASPQVSEPDDYSGYKIRITNDRMLRALRLAIVMPGLYDSVYGLFPEMYNHAGGIYGRITAVRKANARRSAPRAPFSGRDVPVASPEGFIMPLVYGLVSLIDPETLAWRTDPWRFLDQHLQKVVTRYMAVMSGCQFDPQKVGKSLNSYLTSKDVMLLELAGAEGVGAGAADSDRFSTSESKTES